MNRALNAVVLSVLASLTALTPPTILAAQSHSAQQQGVPDSLAMITTDTGAFAPGYKDYSRYLIPELCVAAARNAGDVMTRPLATQIWLATIRDYAPEQDSLPTRVSQIARACGAHFTVEKTDEENLPALFNLALLERNDSLARAVLRHR